MKTKIIRMKRKPTKCPHCGSKKIAEILFGMPAFSEKLERDMKDGKIVLGGCCVSDDDPEWQCVDCGFDIYKEYESEDISGS